MHVVHALQNGIDKMEYKCDICMKIYKYKQSYVNHMKTFGYFFKIVKPNEYKQVKLGKYLDYILDLKYIEMVSDKS